MTQTPLSELCRRIESIIAVPIIQAQLHATISAAAGPGLRRNDHDMIVLQISGRKTWTVYQPGGDPSGQRATPPWNDTLEDGGLLYVPRGWGYIENSFEIPAMHLAIAFRNPTGIEFAARVIERSSRSEFMTMDYPRFQNEEIRSRYLTRFRHEIALAFDEPGVILGYFRDIQALAAPYRLVGLPWATVETALIPKEYIITPVLRFLTAGAGVRSTNRNVIEIHHDGNAIQIDDSLEPVLSTIFSEGGYSIETLTKKCEPEISSERVIALVGDLLRFGLVAVTAPGINSSFY